MEKTLGKVLSKPSIPPVAPPYHSDRRIKQKNKKLGSSEVRRGFINLLFLSLVFFIDSLSTTFTLFIMR